jgi:hypothetical protein
MAREQRFELSELDPHATDLHLVVCATPEFQHAVGTLPCQVARSVEPCDRRLIEGVVDVALRGEFRQSQVPVGQARSPDVDLALLSGCHGVPLGIEYVCTPAGNGYANGCDAVLSIFRHHDVVGGGHHAFARAVLVHQGDVFTKHGPSAAAEPELQGLARDQQKAHAGELAPLGVGGLHQRREHRGHQAQEAGHSAFHREVEQGRWVLGLFGGGNHDPGARRERAQDVAKGRVEGGGGELQHGVIGPDIEAARDVVDVLNDSAMAAFDALGAPRGARGVDHVGGGVVVDLRGREIERLGFVTRFVDAKHPCAVFG